MNAVVLPFRQDPNEQRILDAERRFTILLRREYRKRVECRKTLFWSWNWLQCLPVLDAAIVRVEFSASLYSASDFKNQRRWTARKQELGYAVTHWYHVVTGAVTSMWHRETMPRRWHLRAVVLRDFEYLESAYQELEDIEDGGPECPHGNLFDEIEELCWEVVERSPRPRQSLPKAVPK